MKDKKELLQLAYALNKANKNIKSSLFSFNDEERKACGLVISGKPIDNIGREYLGTHTSLLVGETNQEIDRQIKYRMKTKNKHYRKNIKKNWHNVRNLLRDTKIETEDERCDETYKSSIFCRFNKGNVKSFSNGEVDSEDSISFYNMYWKNRNRDIFINIELEDYYYYEDFEQEIESEIIKVFNCMKNKHSFNNYYFFTKNSDFYFVYKNAKMILKTEINYECSFIDFVNSLKKTIKTNPKINDIDLLKKIANKKLDYNIAKKTIKGYFASNLRFSIKGKLKTWINNRESFQKEDIETMLSYNKITYLSTKNPIKKQIIKKEYEKTIALIEEELHKTIPLALSNSTMDNILEEFFEYEPIIRISVINEKHSF